jgi:hypothetical protein
MYYVTFENTGHPIVTSRMPPEDMTGVYEVEDSFFNGVPFILENEVVRFLTPEEIQADQDALILKFKADEVRAKRDELLKSADVLSQADRWAGYSAKVKTAITDYKQALRDISLQEGFPVDVIFPEVPVI